jgi:hypothetical protein
LAPQRFVPSDTKAICTRALRIEVRCDRDERGDAGCYHVRADGHVAREGQQAKVEREGITNAVRATEKDARSG